MITSFDMCTVDKCRMRITDTTPISEYANEEDDQIRLDRFKYSETSTINIILYKDEILDTTITEHDSELNEVYFTLPKDGSYVIHQLLLPNLQWFENQTQSEENLLGLYNNIYFISDDKFLKYKKEIIEYPIEDNTIFPYLKTVINSDGTLPEKTNWYNIRQHSYDDSENSGHYDVLWWYDQISEEIKIDANDENVNEDLYLWCFVGENDTIKIYNKAAYLEDLQSGLGCYRTVCNTEGPKLSYDNCFWDIVIPDVNNTTNINYINLRFSLKTEIDEKIVYLQYIPSDDDKKFTYGEIADDSCTLRAVALDDLQYRDYSEPIYTEIIEPIDSVLELLEINNEGTTIIKTKLETFAICHLYNCYLNTCKNIYNNMMKTTKCQNLSNSEDLFNRDLLWMFINTIKYNLEFGYTSEAQRLLDEFNHCNNSLCKNYVNKNIKYGCGCS